MAKRTQPSFADYVAITLSPALIMALVGSLVLFLLEIFYGGQYEGRMQWILFSFVFCAVLIARISMTPGISERAPLYGVGLGLLVWFALGKFVEFPPSTPLATFSWAINLGLIALIWWSAHKLTWDCTYIDETVDASGAGLLETAGLEKGQSLSIDEVDTEPMQPETKGSGWWARYEAYRERQSRRPHAPGVWIVYFSLAALPLFGLGQTVIPTDDAAGRQRAFWLMAIYVASALGLLLSTSFLGLRRYLRQRSLQMPVSMTAMWLGIGAVLIVVLLIVGALLPRPYPEYSILTIAKLGSPAREASKYSPGGSEPGKGEGRSGSQGAKEGQGNASGKSDESGGQGEGQGESGSGKGQDGNKAGDGKGKDGSDSGNEAGKGKDQASRKSADNQKQSQSQDQKSADKDSKSESEKSDGSSSDSTGLQPIETTFSGLSKILKWVFLILVGLIVGFFLIRALLRFFANFSGWAKGLLAALDRLWRGLFGWLGPGGQCTDSDERTEPAPRPRPFSSFANPFHAGMTGTPEELVRYSFEALEAWGYERGLCRQDDDTPREFAERIGVEQPDMSDDVRRLAALYARAAYGRGKLPGTALDAVKQFWQKLETSENSVSSTV